MSSSASRGQDDSKRKRSNNRYQRHGNNRKGNKSSQYTNPKRGNPGILLSSEPGKELKCRREGLDLLLHYYYDLEKKQKENKDNEENKEEEKLLSLEDELSMLQKNNKNKKQHEDNLPFTIYDTGCRGIVLLMYNPDRLAQKNTKEVIQEGAKRVKMTLEQEGEEPTTSETAITTTENPNPPFIPTFDPLPILEAIQTDIITKHSTSSPSSRFVLRMIPIQITCFASMEAIHTAAKTVIDMYLLPTLPTTKKEVTTFEIQFQKRICSNVTREEVISNVADLLLHANEGEGEDIFKVDLSNPDYTIMIQICKTICGITIIKDYKRFMKFNLFTLRSSVGAVDEVADGGDDSPAPTE